MEIFAKRKTYRDISCIKLYVKNFYGVFWDNKERTKKSLFNVQIHEMVPREMCRCICANITLNARAHTHTHTHTHDSNKYLNIMLPCITHIPVITFWLYILAMSIDFIETSSSPSDFVYRKHSNNSKCI